MCLPSSKFWPWDPSRRAGWLTISTSRQTEPLSQTGLPNTLPHPPTAHLPLGLSILMGTHSHTPYPQPDTQALRGLALPSFWFIPIALGSLTDLVILLGTQLSPPTHRANTCHLCPHTQDVSSNPRTAC